MTNGKFTIIIIALIGAFIFRECKHSRDISSMEDSEKALSSFLEKELESSFSDMKNAIAYSVYEMNQNVVKSIDDVKSVKAQYPTLSDSRSIVKTESIFKISGSIPIIPPIKSIAGKTDTCISMSFVDSNFIEKGSKASFSSEWYNISITIEDSLKIDSLSVREKIDAVMSWKKSDKAFSFLRKKTPVLSVYSYNPNTGVTFVNNLVVEDKQNVSGKLLLSKPAIFMYGVLAMFIQNKVDDVVEDIPNSSSIFAKDVSGISHIHLRAENGDEFPIFKQDLPSIPTNIEIANFLSNLGLANLI